MKCNHAGCEDQAKSKGFCLRHYKLFWKYGSTEERGSRHAPAQDRFWRFVKKSDGCWNWTGYKDKDGYGTLTIKKENGSHSPIRAHRFSMILNGHEIDERALVLHRCNNPSCVNPDHLYIGDQVQNMQDRIAHVGYSSGEKHFNAKITEEIAEKVFLFEGPAYKAAEEFGISASQARNIRAGRQWRHIYERHNNEKS